MPSITWTHDAFSVAGSGGFFFGDKDGQFGQYGFSQTNTDPTKGPLNNSYFSINLKYTF
jgi:hypothetical protein